MWHNAINPSLASNSLQLLGTNGFAAVAVLTSNEICTHCYADWHKEKVKMVTDDEYLGFSYSIIYTSIMAIKAIVSYDSL